MRSHFTYNERKEAVEAYLSGKMSESEILKQYNCSDASLRRWIAKYKNYGESGFSKTKRKYHT